MSITSRRRSRSHRSNRACVETLEGRRLLSFSPAANFAATASAIATADFNGDGKLDLATAPGFTAGKVTVRLGDGAGGFGAAQEYAVNMYAYSIWAADLNNDTRPDLVVNTGNGYSTLIGNGNGMFQPAVYTDGVSLADVRSYGNAVLAVGTWADGDWGTYVQLYWGNGQGGFSTGANGPAYGGYGGFALVTLNNDGPIDVVSGEGIVFLGGGGGSLRADYEQTTLVPGGGAVATGDFTGDGSADVIVAGNGVAMLRGKGDGTLHPPVYYSANGTNHGAVATADFNADGKLDAIVTDPVLGTVSMMLGNGDGTLSFGGAFATGTSPSSIVVGDFNRDGRADVAVANRGSNNISVLLNDGVWGATPQPSLRISDATVTEGNTGSMNATFTVALSQAAAVDVTVQYNTATVTAVAGSDYATRSGTITIPAGQTSRTFTVSVLGDRVAEPTESFTVNLSSPTNALIADGQGIGTILDNEPRIGINNVSKAEGRSGSTTFTFTVSLSAAYDQAVTVNYATANGTAKAGTDYTSKSGTLTFAPGETIKTITIAVLGDKQKESNETFFVDLFGASSNALISGARGTGTILDDDNSLLTWR